MRINYSSFPLLNIRGELNCALGSKTLSEKVCDAMGQYFLAAPFADWLQKLCILLNVLLFVFF